MPDYSKGKIYKITSIHTNKIYLGSTCKTIGTRKSQHLHSFNTENRQDYESKNIIKLGDWKMDLIEEYPCNSKTELLWRERTYFDYLKPLLVNKQYPILTDFETKEFDRLRSKERCRWKRSWGDERKENCLFYIKIF